MARIFQGASPANEDDELETIDDPPEGFAVDDLPERPEEFAPGLTPELMALVAAASDLEAGSPIGVAPAPKGPTGRQKGRRAPARE
jgi:Mn-containing catalase